MVFSEISEILNKNKIIYLIKILGSRGLGIGDWGLGIGPNPQSPIPNPQSLNKKVRSTNI
jgi:hypothetical protein